MKNQITIMIAITVLLLTLSTMASADNTDPSGAALRAYVEQYLKAAHPTDALAAKINAAGGVNAEGNNEWLCNLEIAATLSIGYRIWETRMRADWYYLKHFSKSQFIPLNITNYCITYSNSCGHWSWNPGCIEANSKSSTQRLYDQHLTPLAAAPPKKTISAHYDVLLAADSLNVVCNPKRIAGVKRNRSIIKRRILSHLATTLYAPFIAGCDYRTVQVRIMDNKKPILYDSAQQTDMSHAMPAPIVLYYLQPLLDRQPASHA